jgi:site-specific DNA-methyltransferase (adenine-specific)
MINLINGNSLEVLATFPENSIYSIVTDPPYELGFMGKKWDSTGIAYNVKLWRECLRVLKPGGHLLAFGGSRTYHRMATAIEDAGFEVRDQMMWIYGSGFPKGYNIANGIDKKLGAEPIVVGSRQMVDFSHHKGSMMMKETAPDNKRRRAVIDITVPSSPEAEKWKGWHTALKPAHGTYGEMKLLN